MEKTQKKPKIRVPPSKIPELSKSTCEIIENIRNTQAPNTQNRAITSITASEKYKHLLSSDSGFALPSSYLKLIKLFRSLDSTIHFFHLQRSSTFYEKVQASVEQTYGVGCKLLMVQQI